MFSRFFLTNRRRVPNHPARCSGAKEAAPQIFSMLKMNI